MADSDVSPRIILQRVRNRLIEYFELASSSERQRAYHARAPVSVSSEIMNLWEDWYCEPIDHYAGPVFSDDERAALESFDATWTTVAEHTPDMMPALSELLGTREWELLRRAASDALDVFLKRGRLREDEEWSP